MRLMAAAFNTTLPQLENELTELILSGRVRARVDSHSKVLYARDVDDRSTAYEKACDGFKGKENERPLRGRQGKVWIRGTLKWDWSIRLVL